MLKYVIKGKPVTKKNSQRILRNKAGRPFIAPSANYTSYERGALLQIRPPAEPISTPVNVRALYFMPDRRKCDLVNLLEATCDILVKARVLSDDNSRVVASHDGSKVLYDKENPRVEICVQEAGHEG